LALEIGKTYFGFKLEKENEIKEINSTTRLFYHEKSGARLYFIENEDDNKVFSISFRTPPKDSTGVAHILEHSVLCGSRKFPLKEPFVELIKGSLNTFLNAFTFSDKTMYPVASKNDKDFLNLMDVYLDAVFYPNIYKYKEIMMQEGWHYELDSSEDEITYKGVVYNEMKGAFSSPESILFRKVQESLFPDTAYGVESGGDPSVIPELTQENFIAFHKKYYHPTNSYIFLYGNINIEEKLKFLNDNYLSDFDKIEVDSSLKVQKPFSSMKKVVSFYPISTNEKEEEKTLLSLNFSAERATNPEMYLALDILEYLLLETQSSPLKKALIDSKLGKDVFGIYDGSILQPVFGIVVKNTDEKKADEFKKVVYDTLENLVRVGIDKKLIEAAINIKEFELRESDSAGYPKGLVYDIKCMDSWLYDEDPDMHLSYEAVLSNIKSALKSDYFEKLITKYILENNHSSMVIVKPQRGLEEEETEKLRKVLSSYKKGLSKAQITQIVENTKMLKLRQNEAESEETLKKIPLLSISDINKKISKIPLIVKEENNVKVLAHPMFTNKITYLNLYFDLNKIREDDIYYVGLITYILGKVNTKKYSYGELSNEININTGGIRYSTDVLSENGSDNFYPKFIVKAKALTKKLPELIGLLIEILSHSKYDDSARLKNIVSELKSRIEMAIFDKGHMVAARRLSSYFSPEGAYKEKLSGISYYKFLVELETNFDSRSQELTGKLNEVAKAVFNQSNLLIGVTSEESEYDALKSEITALCSGLDASRLTVQPFNFKENMENEGIMNSGKVQFVAKGYNLKKLGYKYDGSLLVLKTIINYDYLWNRIRVQGGAYGCFSSFLLNGDMCFVSYRDPNLKQTLESYDDANTYLDNFNVSDREMTKYIIGTISDLDAPLTPSMKGLVSDEFYIRKITDEDLQRERDEVLATDKGKIRSESDLISKLMSKNYICVLGNEEKIKKNSDLFNKTYNLFE
jgi:presequence protease